MSELKRGDGVIIRAGAVSATGLSNDVSFEARIVNPNRLMMWPEAGPWLEIQPGDPSIEGRIFHEADVTHHAEQI